MKGIKLSKNSCRYISTLYLLIAVLLNVAILAMTIFLDVFFDIKYKIVMNLLVLTFTIGVYIWAFLISNTLIRNYKYVVTNKKIEVEKGAIIVSRKVMYIKNVYKIEVKRGIIGRIFKVANIKFFSSGGSVKLSYIDYDEVDKIEGNVRKEMGNIYEK